MANTPTLSGYDCNKFVETPPDKLICQICLLVPHSPHQVTCCGKLYCKACVDEHKKQSSICPNCGKRGMTNFHDTICEQEIKSLKVMCHNSKNGCVWVGELQSLDDHLTTCEYILIRCTNKCMNTDMKEVYVLCCNLEVHLKDRCPNRQYQCPYCKAIGRRCDMTTTHFNTCPKLKVTCPNNDCKASVPRCDLADHRSKCQFEKVQCKYAGIGCEEELIRKDQEQHESNDTFHLHLAIETVNELQKKINRQQEEINAQHEESKKQLEAINAQHEKSKTQWEEIKKQREESKKQWEEIGKQRAESEKQREEIDRQQTDSKVQREEIDKQRAESKKQIDKQRAESRKQREEIDEQREEIDRQQTESKVQRKEIDKQRAEIDKQRAESKKQREEIDKQREEIDKQRAESKQQREEIDKQQAESKQQREEIDKQRAESKQQREEIDKHREEIDRQQAEGKKQLKEVKENIVAGQAGSRVFKFPKFNQHKSSKQEWFSPPFYTHPGGYKMCIRVDANGGGDGEDTHVSVYARLMRGKNDDNLSWPFTGKVTITLLNQLADRHHHTRTTSFSQGSDICGRVMDGEMATTGYGEPKFISHTQLNAQQSFQYRKGDCLYFRIEVQASKPVKPWLTCTV